MGRKRITQIFPWLLPMRKWERKLFFYAKMHFDDNTYSWRKSEERLGHSCYHWESEIINPNTGHDIQYQHNKAHNLRLACETLDGLLIRPGEIFSFWQRVRYAEEREAYRDGLSQVADDVGTAFSIATVSGYGESGDSSAVSEKFTLGHNYRAILVISTLV